jgi:hypothetical protein
MKNKGEIFMKKLLLLIFLMFTVLSYAGYETNIKEKISKLERQKEEKISEYGFGYEVNKINEEFNNILDDELTKVYNLIRNKMSKTEKINFRNKQRQWLKKRTQQVEAVVDDAVRRGIGSGSSIANLSNYEYQEITKKRLYEFAKMYDKMKK